MANKYIGGDILEISCSHPTLGDFRFQTKSNESYSIDFGGFRNNDDANAISGGGKLISQKNRVRGSFEGPLLVDMTQTNEIEKIPELAESPEPAIWTISHISGAVYKFKAEVVGDLVIDTNTAQMPVKLSGEKIERVAV